MQGIHLGLAYIFQGIKLLTFEESATRVHDMELSIISHENNSPIIDLKIKRRNLSDCQNIKLNQQ